MNKTIEIPSPDNLWDYVVEKGREIEGHYTANSFSRYDIHTILATMEFFGATETWMRQTHYDLTIPKYRLFDWLAMCIMGRNDDSRENNNIALKVLVYSWLKTNGNPEEFIQDLCDSDYQIDTSWEEVKIE